MGREGRCGYWCLVDTLPRPAGTPSNLAGELDSPGSDGGRVWWTEGLGVAEGLNGVVEWGIVGWGCGGLGGTGGEN